MRRRVVCIALTQIRVEIAMEGTKEESPLAVVVARPGGAVKTERDVLGNTKIDVVSTKACALGVRAGQTVAAARAKCAELRLRVVKEGVVRGALERIAEMALVFGPTVAFDEAQDVVWIEVGGCSHLHGGERGLARELRARVKALGYSCRVVVADGPRVSAAFARFAPQRPNCEEVVIPEGKGAMAMRPLPVASLSLDDDTTRWLVRLGIRTCGDLQKLPRSALGTRLGERASDVSDMLRGDDRAPLDAWRPPEVPQERAELEWGAESVEALTFVIKMLCDRLASRLESRAMAASRLELELEVDSSPRVSTVNVALPTPIARSADMLSVLRARLEGHALSAPVLVVTLRAHELASANGRTRELLSPEPKADGELPRLVTELVAELGETSVGTLALVDTWAPVERTRLDPFGRARAPRRSELVTSAIEPSRLVDPWRVPLEWILNASQNTRRIARIEAVEWWRRGPRESDLWAVWISGKVSGQDQCQGLAWVELAKREAWLRGWLD